MLHEQQLYSKRIEMQHTCIAYTTQLTEMKTILSLSVGKLLAWSTMGMEESLFASLKEVKCRHYVVLPTKNLAVKHLPGDRSLPKIGQEVCMLKRRAAQEDPVLPELTPGSRKTQMREEKHRSHNSSSCS